MDHLLQHHNKILYCFCLSVCLSVCLTGYPSFSRLFFFFDPHKLLTSLLPAFKMKADGLKASATFLYDGSKLCWIGTFILNEHTYNIYFIQGTPKLLTDADRSTDRRIFLKTKNIIKIYFIMCYMSHFPWPMLRVTCHLFLTPTAKDHTVLTPPLSKLGW